jgi:hypothetical protein
VNLLAKRLADQERTGQYDEPYDLGSDESTLPSTLPHVHQPQILAPPPTPTPSPPTSSATPHVYTTTDPKKLASKKKRKRKREATQAGQEDPGLRDSHLKHRQ